MRMTFRVLLLLAIVIALAGPAMAQSDRPAGASTKSKKESALVGTPMVFYLAKGDADACGQGCGEWIAAEGYLDLGAAHRLRAFLNRVGRRQLPIFFYSPGGMQAQALALGRLMRQRGMTAGVAKTVPAGCMSVGEQDKTCDALKRSGQTLLAELRTASGRCNSACVYALIGAKARQVPPGARLGVHSGKLIYFYSDGRVRTPSRDKPSSGDKTRVAEFDSELRRYILDMGIDIGLLEVASKVPHDQAHYLSRDEIVRFGIDTREFQETRWMAMELPPQPLSAVKFLVEAKGASRREFRISILQLACAGPRRVRIVYFRGLGSDEIGATKTIKLALDNRMILLPGMGSISKIDAIDTGGSFDARFTYEWFEVFEAAAARDSIEIVESDPTGTATSSRVTKVSTAGMAHAISVLRTRCGTAI
jgi:hypothetical protein